MFRCMRRIAQQLPSEETEKILLNGKSGVLACLGDNDYPYAVPMCYAYESGKIYFHSAVMGHKIDAIEKCEKISFCVTEKDEIIPEKFNTDYVSVIAFGKAKILTEGEMKKYAMKLLVEKYSAGYEKQGAIDTEKKWRAFCVVEMDIEYVTGKKAMIL